MFDPKQLITTREEINEQSSRIYRHTRYFAEFIPLAGTLISMGPRCTLTSRVVSSAIGFNASCRQSVDCGQ